MKTFLHATVATAAVCLAQVPDAPTTSTPTVATTVPAAPHFLLDTVGPDGWRTRLGPTNLGSLLASEQGKALWQPSVLPLLGQAKAMLGGDETGAAAEERLLGHRGRIRIGVWLDLEARSAGDAIAMATLIEGDGRTDLASLANDLRTLFAMAIRGDEGKLELGGALRDVRREDGDAFVLPFVDGNHVLLAVGPEAMVPAVFAAEKVFGNFQNSPCIVISSESSPITVNAAPRRCSTRRSSAAASARSTAKATGPSSGATSSPKSPAPAA